MAEDYKLIDNEEKHRYEFLLRLRQREILEEDQNYY